MYTKIIYPDESSETGWSEVYYPEAIDLLNPPFSLNIRKHMILALHDDSGKLVSFSAFVMKGKKRVLFHNGMKPFHTYYRHAERIIRAWGIEDLGEMFSFCSYMNERAAKAAICSCELSRMVINKFPDIPIYPIEIMEGYIEGRNNYDDVKTAVEYLTKIWDNEEVRSKSAVAFGVVSCTMISYHASMSVLRTIANSASNVDRAETLRIINKNFSMVDVLMSYALKKDL